MLRDSIGRFVTKGGVTGKAKKKLVAAHRKPATTLAEAMGHGSPVARPINIVGFVRDVSGSMRPYERDLDILFSELWKTTADASNALGQDTRAAVYDFSDVVRTVATMRDINQPHHAPPCRTGGGTALYDTVLKVIADMKRNAPPGASFLVNVLTDGDATDGNNLSSFKLAIAEYQRLGNWTFSFQLPPGWVNSFAAKTGVPRDNLREWEPSREGLIETISQTKQAMTNFTAMRSVGATASASYYAPVTTDLSQVSSNQIKTNLNDLSGRFRSLTVDKECPVRSFVEAKTGAPYIVGSAYYMLMKKEEVQPQKNVLIQEKGKKQVWGGTEARELIGLPAAHEGKLAKVTPGNHSNFDIYVQSTSVNRILPRGTKVLVDLGHNQHSQPTWNHNAVAQQRTP